MKGFLKTLVLVSLALVLMMSVASCKNIWGEKDQDEQTTTEPVEQSTPADTDPTTDPATDPTTDPVTDPTVTDPTETDPTETDPTVTDPTETDPTETDPTETDPAETDPAETDPTETDPTETDPTETDPGDAPGPIDPPAHEHSYVAAVTDPTCTAKGFTTYTCACGDTYTADETDALGHTAGAAATCTTAQVCTVCNAELAAALGHTWDDATCTAPKTCSVCGATEGDALGHTAGAAATCTTAQVCTVCNAELTAALGHTWDDATCTAPKTCSVCGATEGEALNHSYVPAVTDPTCTAAGFTTYTCVCGDNYTADEVPATGHSGYETDYKCDACKTIMPPMANETLTIPQANALGLAHAAKTYTADKYYVTGVITSIINTTYGNVYIQDAEGNSFYVYGLYTDSIRYDAMEVKPGVGDTITVYGVIGTYDAKVAQMKDAQVTAHTVCEHVYEVAETVDATCTNDGYIKKVCTLCELNEIIETIPAGHKYEEGLCTVCGKVETIVTNATISFADTANRTDFSTTQQIWVQNGITVTNLKGGSTSNVGDYANPARFYKGSTVIIEFTGMTKLVIDASGMDSKYATPWKADLEKAVTGTGATVSELNGVFTVVFATPTNSITVITSAQIRANSITVQSEIERCFHKDTVVEGAFDATCTENGYTGDTRCTKCGNIVAGEVIPATGHSHEADVTAPTCEAEGFTTYTCACGDSYVADTVAALGHTWDDATCTAPKTCSVCGATEGEANGHTWDDATCTLPKTCSVCGATEGEANGHDYKWVVDTEPSFDAEGVKHEECSVCGDKQNEGTIIEKLTCEHNMVKTDAKDATCLEAGNNAYYTCSNCGKVYSDAEGALETTVAAETLAALGHNTVADEAVEPKCEEAGLTAGSHCDRCGEVFEAQEVVEATGHDYDADVTKATCEKGGYTTYTCTVCGNSYEDDQTDALGHDYDADVTDATCTAAGFTTYTCTVCGDSYTEDGEAALGHTAGEAATCTTAQICTVCNAELEAALGHNYVYGTCSNCGKVIEFSITNATISFATTTSRVTSTTTKQVWEQNGITFTYEKNTYNSNLADYSNPIRLYAGTKSTIAFPGMTKIVIKCNNASYASACQSAVGTPAGATVTVNGSDVTIVFAEPQNSFSFIPGAQIRVNSIEVTAEETCAHTPDADATCTTAQRCTICGTTIVAAKGHTAVVDEAVSATCTTPGLTEGSHCSVCDEVIVAQEVVDALGHTTVVDDAVAPKCEDAGLTEGSHCSVCNEVFVAQEEVEATGHNYADGVCTACGQAEGHIHNYVADVTEPTCTAPGFTTYTCDCEDSYIADEVPATGHTPGEAATCTTAQICTVCDAELVAALNHAWDNACDTDCNNACGETREIEHAYAADGKCSVCGAEDPNAPKVLATFNLGANGSASHNDGSSKTSYSETNNGQTLSISTVANFYTGARDAKGNSCIKLGTGSKAGSFSFTVGADVNKVVIYIAKYKANAATVKINNTAYTLSKNSNDGAYDVIEIDTSSTKTINLAVSSGYRAMVNTIEFWG